MQDVLKNVGLEPERVVTQEVAITDNQRVVKLVNDLFRRERANPSAMTEETEDLPSMQMPGSIGRRRLH